MKLLSRLGLPILAIFVAAAIWAGYMAHSFLTTPPEENGKDVFIDIQPGASLRQVANELYDKGLITSPRKFVWLARYRNLDKSLQAGRFLLNTGWLPDHILEALGNGMPALYRVTIPEGLTWWQTGRLLQEAGLARAEDFEAVIHDPEFLRHYGIPFSTAEGFLMPDTYLVGKPKSEMPPAAYIPQNEEEAKVLEDWRKQARSVAGRMIDNFWRKTASLWPQTGDAEAPPARPARADLKKWVTLASIVEKETGVANERGRVAGVYTNRLARNMLLQADPTVIYGIGPAFPGRLKRVHLEDPANAYNTYYYPGLPPGPISSFGLAALKAAINPEKHDYLFFVATGTGDTHTFSRNFEDHSRAVQKYRETQKGK